MTKGSWAATAAAGILVPANEDRAELTFQYISGDPVFITFRDDDAVVGEGISVSESTPVLVIDDYRSVLAVKGICDTGLSTAGCWLGA